MKSTNKINKESQKESELEEISLLNYCYEQLSLIENKTGLKGGYVISLLFLLIVFVVFGFMDKFITNTVGTIYPVFRTIKSIEDKSNEEMHWLSYWIIFGVFSILDSFSFGILQLIPFYFVFKILFLLWCYMPNTQGSIIIYNLFVSKILKKLEININIATESFKNEIDRLVENSDNPKGNYIYNFKDN